MKRSWLIHFALVAALPGCSDTATAPPDGAAGDGATTAPRDMASATDMTAPPDLAPAGYPAGPYGFNIGDTVTPLVWEGYLAPDPTNLASSTFGPYGMDELRRSGAPYALVHISEYF